MGKKPPQRRGVGSGASDFKRVRGKVGRKLPPAANATDTRVRARRIAMPRQNLRAGEDDPEYPTSRDPADDSAPYLERLVSPDDDMDSSMPVPGVSPAARSRPGPGGGALKTLGEWVTQVGHYSAKSRRDALHGLRDCLMSHPAQLPPTAAAVVATCAERLVDVDPGVRDALLSTLITGLLPALTPAALASHLPLMLAHARAAMTHDSAGVRATATAAVDALVAAAPAAVTSPPHAAPLLRQYAALVARAAGRSSPGSAGVVAPPAALARLVASLERFLAARAAATGGAAAVAQSVADDRAPAAMFDAGAPGVSGADLLVTSPPPCGLRLSGQHTITTTGGAAWGVAAFRGVPRWCLPSAGVHDVMTHAVGDDATSASTLIPALLDALAACSGGLTSGGADEGITPDDRLSCVRAAVCVVGALRHLLPPGTPPPPAVLSPVLRRLLPLLLVGETDAAVAAACASARSEFGVRSVCLLAPHVGSPLPMDDPSLGWEAPVCDMLAGGLESAAFKFGKGAPSGKGGPTAAAHQAALFPSTADALSSLLIAAGATLAGAPPPSRRRVTSACTRLLESLPASSPGVAPALRFAAALVGRPDLAAVASSVVTCRLVAPLPRLIWQMGAKRPRATALALATMLTATRRATPGSALDAALAAIVPQLPPLFCAPGVDPTGRKRKAGDGAPPTPLWGPFVSFTPGLQSLLLDCVAGLAPCGALGDATVLASLARVCFCPRVGIDVATRVVTTVRVPAFAGGGAQVLGGAAASARLSFLFTLLAGRNRDGLGPTLPGPVLDWCRHMALVTIASATLTDGLEGGGMANDDDDGWPPLAALAAGLMPLLGGTDGGDGPWVTVARDGDRGRTRAAAVGLLAAVAAVCDASSRGGMGGDDDALRPLPRLLASHLPAIATAACVGAAISGAITAGTLRLGSGDTPPSPGDPGASPALVMVVSCPPLLAPFLAALVTGVTAWRLPGAVAAAGVLTALYHEPSHQIRGALRGDDLRAVVVAVESAVTDALLGGDYSGMGPGGEAGVAAGRAAAHALTAMLDSELGR